MNAQMSWLDEALKGADDTVAARYRTAETISYLERALDGVPDAQKIAALRTMINLEVKPNDEVLILLAVFGKLAEAGIVIPQRIVEASREMDLQVDKIGAHIEVAVAEIETFADVANGCVKKVIAEVDKEAHETAGRAVKAAILQETDKTRLMVLAHADDAFQKFEQQILKRQLSVQVDPIVAKRSVIMGVLGSMLFALGALGGFGFGSVHPFGDASQGVTMLYGRQFLAMYPDMPTAQRAWYAGWVRKHPLR